MTGSSTTDWIQCFIASLALAGLFWYCIETSFIRRATLAQTDASRRPFPMLTGLTMEDKELILVNAGVGIAMNISWCFEGQSGGDLQNIGSLPPGAHRELTDHGEVTSYLELILHGSLRVTYSDTAGKKYWTTFTPKEHEDKRRTTVTETGEEAPYLSLQERIDKWNRSLEGL